METNSTDYIEGVNSNQIVLSILQEQDPGLTELPSITAQTNVARTVTPVYDTPGAINHYPELIPLDRSENGVIQIDGDDDSKSLNIPLQKLMFVDQSNYEEIIDTEYTYFIDTIDIDSENLPDIVGKFIILPKFSIPTANGPSKDMHLYYILQNAFPDLEMLSVFFGKREKGRDILYRIPDYKTLEVMLVSRGLTYDAIQIYEKPVVDDLVRRTLNDILPSDDLNTLNAGINAAAAEGNLHENRLTNLYIKSLPVLNSLLASWNIQTRFESNYKPATPFKRDPADYIGQSIQTDLPTNVDKITSKEKLRDKYEGRIVLFKDLNDDNESLDADDIEGCRMLFYGRWRPVFSLDVLTLYGTETGGDISFRVDNGGGGQSGFNQSLPEGASIIEQRAFDSAQEFRFGLLRNALRTLADSGVIITLNEDGVNSPIWNSFPQALRPLEVDEYKQYLKLSDVFDVDYLAPYEPRGSVKYYDPARNGERGSELFPGNRLIDPLTSAPESLKEALLEDLEAKITAVADAITDTGTLVQDAERDVNALINWKEVADDIVDGENDRFKYIIARNGGVATRGNGTKNLDKWLLENAIASSIFDPIGFFGASSGLREASMAFSFDNTQERTYKDKLNTITPGFEASLPVARQALQTAEENLVSLGSMRAEIITDTFITAFDNYQSRIDELGSDAVVGGLVASVDGLNVYRTQALNAYTEYLSTLNREVNEVQSALGAITLLTPGFESSLANGIDVDPNIINNLI